MSLALQVVDSAGVRLRACSPRRRRVYVLHARARSPRDLASRLLAVPRFIRQVAYGVSIMAPRPW